MATYIDISATYLNWHGSPTGIQRVAMGLAAAVGTGDVKLVAFQPSRQRWYTVDPQAFQKIFQIKRVVTAKNAVHPIVERRPGGWRRAAARLLPRQVRALLNCIHCQFWALVADLARWTCRRMRDHQLATEGEPVVWTGSDVLLVIDSNWTLRRFLPALEKLQVAFPGM